MGDTCWRGCDKRGQAVAELRLETSKMMSGLEPATAVFTVVGLLVPAVSGKLSSHNPRGGKQLRIDGCGVLADSKTLSACVMVSDVAGR
jgi:hypothetical protein